MTDADIAAVIKLFADAARRAEEADYNGVQIHAAHNFFLSGLSVPPITIAAMNTAAQRQGGERLSLISCGALKTLRQDFMSR